MLSGARSRPRVAVIGFDAAEWNLIEALLASGDLPHLARLQARGATCRLRQPWPLTEQPWAELLTGAPTSVSALRFEPSTYATYEVGAPRVAPFYARTGVRAIVLDVPRMTLAYPTDGVQISGWGGHHLGYPRASSPAGLLTEMDREIGVHPAFSGFNEFRWYDPRGVERFTRQLVAGALRRVDVVRWLAGRLPDWDLLLTVSPEAHTAGQILWHGVDQQHLVTRHVNAAIARRQLFDVYKALDTAVGRLVEELPAGTTVVVCSLHGIQLNHHDVASALLPELLSRVFAGEGLFAIPDPAGWRRLGYPPVEPGMSGFAAKYGRPRSVAHRFNGWLSHHARRRAPALVALSRSLRVRAARHEPETETNPDAIGEYLTTHDNHVACRYRPLWPRMKAFAMPTYTNGRVRINLRGRERDGIVAPEDYQQTCDEVEAVVRACRNPRTGEPVVDEVIRGVDQRLSPEHSLADLTIMWRGCPDALDHPDVGLIGPLAYGRTGSHSRRGFAFIAGPGIAHADLGERSALDMTSTIVSLLGHDPSGAFCGSPIVSRQPVLSEVEERVPSEVAG